MANFVNNIWYLFMTSILSSFSSARSLSPKISDTTEALLYLSKYGYMVHRRQNDKIGSLISEDTIRNSIKEFQAFANLNITGELDEETIKLMNTPRCGVQDKIGYGANVKRKKRYALQGSRWRVRNLTYKIVKYPLALTKAEVDRDLKKAFGVWEDVTDLKFEQIKGKGKIHIEVRFEKGEHGDGDPFDGPGGTLAHAYFPIYGGDAHFDQSEVWSIDSSRGTNLLQVAAHEFGHSLGLSHSDVHTSLMAPFYRSYIPNFKLDKDDIKAIQSLYGKAPKPEKKPAVIPRKDNPNLPTNSICSKKKMDTIVTMVDQKTYVFIGSQYWQLLNDGVAKGYPRSIAKDFDGLEDNLDAGFTWSESSKTYFFKRTKYWRFTDKAMDDGYPKEISKGFTGIPNNIDSAFVWSGNGKIYFFKGDKYWRFDPEQVPPVRTTYPKLISNWKDIPNEVDGALQYSNGHTYFFKGTEYWRFNDRSFSVDVDDPSFPRPVDYWWFGCPDKGNQKDSKTVSDPVEDTDSLVGAHDTTGSRKFDADDLSVLNTLLRGSDTQSSNLEEEDAGKQIRNGVAPATQFTMITFVNNFLVLFFLLRYIYS